MINVPTKNQRKDILLSHLCELPVSTDLDLDHLSDVTNGYVGADLAALCHEAAYIAINERTGNQTEENKVHRYSFYFCFGLTILVIMIFTLFFSPITACNQ